MSLPEHPRESEVQYRIRHITRFRYRYPVRRCTMSLCLQPLESSNQRLLRFRVNTTPSAHLNTETDPFGNVRHVLTLHRNHERLEVVSNSHVAVNPPAVLPESLASGAWDEVRAAGNDPRWWDFTAAGPLTRPTPSLSRFMTELDLEPGGDPLSDLKRLSSALHDAFEYTPGATTVDSPIDEILASRRGVCQDYTHVLVTIARSWGVPARYVSGYLYIAGSGSEDDGAAFRAASHAWAEVLLPELGWIGIDPTNRTMTDERYVRIAVGRDYRDVPPTRGVIEGGGKSQMDVDVRMSLL